MATKKVGKKPLKKITPSVKKAKPQHPKAVTKEEIIAALAVLKKAGGFQVIRRIEEYDDIIF